jgi:hypothetical protein
MICCCSGSDFDSGLIWFRFWFGSGSDPENTSVSKKPKKIAQNLAFSVSEAAYFPEILIVFFISFLLDSDPKQVPET